MLAFEVLLNVTSMFNHSNVAVPAADRILRVRARQAITRVTDDS